jgi:murein DD-endopeptidase MepM/ murein hydrolase activator NlpD
MEYIDSIVQRLRFIIVGLLILASLVFLVGLFSAPVTAQQADPDAAEMTMAMYDGPNAVTNSMGLMGHRAGQTADRIGASFSGVGTGIGKGASTVGNGFAAVGSGFAGAGNWTVGAVSNTGSFITHTTRSGASAFGRSARTTAVIAGRGLAGGLKATVMSASSVVGLVSNTPVVSAAVAPQAIIDKPTIATKSPGAVTLAHASEDHTDDEKPHAEAAAQQQPAPAPAITVDNTASWPIHGEITTYFGVEHWPYQPTHTGIDISDGWISGVTPVHPYRPGKVIEVYREYTGLGHHVVIDHGGGITSVYGHMSSILVNPGQDVDKNTVLGMEGSTGASTGTHVHFEIRVNGTPVNPLDYVPGRP